MSIEQTEIRRDTLDWNAVRFVLPPEGRVVETKIHDRDGARNEQELKRQGSLWFFPDGSMYVYYAPTHWRRPDAVRTSGGREG